MADAGGGFASNEYLLLAFFGLSTVAFLWYMYKVVGACWGEGAGRHCRRETPAACRAQWSTRTWTPRTSWTRRTRNRRKKWSCGTSPRLVRPACLRGAAAGAGRCAFPPAELAAFNGEGDAPIYLGVRGFVFDVSESKDFYGAGGSYESLAGADASLGLAAMETDPAKWPTYSSVEELSAMERETLDDWLRRFEEKYPLMGFLTDGFDGRDYDGMLAAAQAAEAAEAAGADAAGGEETALEDTPAADGVRHRGGDGDAAPVTAAAGDKAKTE